MFIGTIQNTDTFSNVTVCDVAISLLFRITYQALPARTRAAPGAAAAISRKMWNHCD